MRHEVGLMSHDAWSGEISPSAVSRIKTHFQVWRTLERMSVASICHPDGWYMDGGF